MQLGRAKHDDGWHHRCQNWVSVCLFSNDVLPPSVLQKQLPRGVG